MHVDKASFLISKENDVEYIESPNQSKVIAPEELKFIVIHYTSGPSLESAVNWFQRPVAKASAHLIIDDLPLALIKDTPEESKISAKVVQMVPFARKAWHAGRSEWDASNGCLYTGLNSNSIGIELVNPGQLSKTVSNDWITWYGEVFKDIAPPPQRGMGTTVPVPISVHEVLESTVTNSGWATYPPYQIKCLINVINALMNTYPIEDILAHSDIAPDRKVDPGPAFPMFKIRNMFIVGRRG